jgi:hypothetical protein
MQGMGTAPFAEFFQLNRARDQFLIFGRKIINTLALPAL